jgi:radical SAM superfamily enzyme YgiQ (UPF0313 family)
MMAHINYVDESKYIELVKILVYKIFYIHIDREQAYRLKQVLDDFYHRLELYFTGLVERENPQVLGISVYRDTLPATLFVFRLVRKKFPHIKNIMGGGIFSIQLTRGSPNLEIFLEKTRGCIDKVVIGKGEPFFLEYLEGRLPKEQRLVAAGELGISGPVFPGLDMYDFSDFDPHHYHYQGAQGSTSCPNQCSFCNVASFYGEYRIKDPRQPVAEMKEMYETYGTQVFFMLDSMLNEVADGIASELSKSDVSLYWDGYFRVDPSCTRGKAFTWRQGGFYRARIGVESGSQKVLDLMNKGITVEQIKETVSNLAFAGIKTTAYIVIGHPGETEEDFQQTLDLMEELKNDIWEAESNPFTYFYSGQSKNDEWADRRTLLYPPWANDMLIYRTWYVKGVPTREELYDRVFRFVEHCKKLGISTPWALQDVNKSDERWQKLQVNAVPPLLDLFNKKKYIDECKRVKQYICAENTMEVDEEFNF